MADLINTGYPAVATEYGAALQMPRAGIEGPVDWSRAAILAEDIAACLADHGRIEMQVLLAQGWTIEELARAEHAATRTAARRYLSRIDEMERRSMIGLLLCLAAAIVIIALGMARDLTLPGV